MIYAPWPSFQSTLILLIPRALPSLAPRRPALNSELDRTVRRFRDRRHRDAPYGSLLGLQHRLCDPACLVDGLYRRVDGGNEHVGTVFGYRAVRVWSQWCDHHHAWYVQSILRSTFPLRWRLTPCRFLFFFPFGAS